MKKVQAVTGNLYEHENEYYIRINTDPGFNWYHQEEDGNLNQIDFDSAEYWHLENTLHGYINGVKL
jgi:hypothetical protein